MTEMKVKIVLKSAAENLYIPTIIHDLPGTFWVMLESFWIILGYGKNFA